MSPDTSNPEFPPLVVKMLGTWEGTYRTISTTTGQVTDTHKCKIEIGIRGSNFLQRNTYTWDDGRVQVHDIPGRMRNGKLQIESDRLQGYYVVLSDDTVMVYGKMKNFDYEAWDCIRLLDDNRRARTWQVKMGGRVTQIVLVDEVRTSTDDAYVEIGETPSR